MGEVIAQRMHRALVEIHKAELLGRVGGQLNERILLREGGRHQGRARCCRRLTRLCLHGLFERSAGFLNCVGVVGTIKARASGLLHDGVQGSKGDRGNILSDWGKLLVFLLLLQIGQVPTRATSNADARSGQFGYEVV